jgi:pyruvate ferredoxin oxidoreductase alpha subunit
MPRSQCHRDGSGGSVSQTLPHGRMVLTANDAAAYAAMLARVRAIGCYPITPQTLIVERLADLVAGRDDIEFANLESEHSMFGYVVAAARAGVRTFTATSSQGLLYAHEQLHRASRERVPLVIVNVNRAVFAPWSIEPDLSDSMSQRDTGWIQLYCSSAQEVLDSVLCAYRIAETVMLPVMVCAEGFLLSHTSEVLDVPEQDAVDAFIPELRPPDDWLIDPAKPHVFSALPQPNTYFAFQHDVATAMDAARTVIADVAAQFTSHFQREKIGALEISGDPEADAALVTIGTIGDTARELLDADDDLLLVRVHAFRPFPAAELASALADASYVSVIDRAPGFGSFGPLGGDVKSLDLKHLKAATNFICGLGGVDVTPGTLRWALRRTRSSTANDAPVYVPEGV